MITVTEKPSGTLIRVDGWLTGEGVTELVRVLNSAPAPIHVFVHDLRGADAAGLSVLGRLAGEGVALDGLSPYIQLMLAKPANPEPLSSRSIARSETPVRREGI
jgi:hypothetical protein